MDIKADIIYEDESVAAVNKPEGLASIPGFKLAAPSLLDILSSRGTGKIYVVHRLDKAASGVIIFAKTAKAHKELQSQFEGRRVEKNYLLLAHGNIEKNSGVIDLPLRQFGSGRSGVDAERGKPSATEFEVLARPGGFTLCRARLITGRRHQIRAHFYAIGHPLAGDTRYYDKRFSSGCPRLMLHARSIAFGLNGKDLRFEAPVPPSFREALARSGCTETV